MPERLRTIRLPCTKNARNMRGAGELSLQIRNLNSDWMKTELSYWATKC